MKRLLHLIGVSFSVDLFPNFYLQWHHDLNGILNIQQKDQSGSVSLNEGTWKQLESFDFAFFV